MTNDAKQTPSREAHFASQCLAASFDPVFAWQWTGPISYWGPVCERVYGYGSREALGALRQDLLKTEFPVPHVDVVRTLETSGSWTGDCRITARGGQILFVECRLRRLDDADGTVIEAHRDISDRKRAEEALGENETRFRSLIALSADWYWEQDENFRFRDFSGAVLDLSGSRAEALIGKTRWELAAPGLSDEAWADHRRGLERHEPFRNFEYRRINERGEAIWLSVSGDPVCDPSGHFKGYRGTGRNITMRKRAEDMLARNNASLAAQVVERTRQLEAMLDAAVNAILTIDTHGVIRSANAATTKLLGFTEGELCGQNVKMIMPDTYARGHDGFIASYVATGKKKIIGIGREVAAQRKDGTAVPIHLSVGEFEANGRRFFTGIITDLSDRKAAEDILRETERQLAQAQKMEAVGQLTGGLAHDFNNLLTVIMGNLELLDMRLEDATDRDLVRRADEAARIGARLISRLLTFSRRRALQPTVVQLNDTTVGMTELLRRSLGENVSVTSELASDLWTTRVDPNEIENAILNLAINARDAMPNGGRILIETSNVVLSSEDLTHSPDAAPGEYVKLTVSDNGKGMSSEVVARAFEPFFTTKGAGRGTGLGLSTIYGFVKQSGGHANIYSEVGRGTAVSLYLPRDKSSAGIPSFIPKPAEIKRAVGETILVVEDNEQVRELTTRRLEALGYNMFVAENGPDAIALLEQHKSIDLVFTDVVMPGGMTGFDVARWIKQYRPEVRILLTSGFAPEMVNAQTAPDVEATLLRKPYKQVDLARAVREALSK